MSSGKRPKEAVSGEEKGGKKAKVEAEGSAAPVPADILVQEVFEMKCIEYCDVIPNSFWFAQILVSHRGPQGVFALGKHRKDGSPAIIKLNRVNFRGE